MSISNAMQASVSGLKANASAVSEISANIANAGTDGYRRTFAQMVTTTVTATGGGAAPAGGVRAVQTAEVDTDGQLRTTQRATDMAISGPGFFVVSKNPNEPDQANYMLTRAGSFRPDENGNLKNAAGLYLAGFPYDTSGSLGVVDRNTFADLSTVNTSNMTVQGQATSEMSLAGNLPEQATGLATPGDAFVSSASFYSPLGATERLQFSWQPSATANQWQLTVSDGTGTDYGTVDVDFHDSGAFAGAPQTYSGVTSLATAPAGFAFDTATGMATLTINNGATPQTIEVALGAPDSLEGLTQFSGDYSPLDVTSDGSASGTLVRTEIDDSGDVYGVFDNGGRQALFSIPLAVVPNPNGLLATDANAYFQSRDSGAFELATANAGPTGSITSGALEGSNVEIAQELTDLITTQRAYSSNAKIITTVDEMLDETMRIKR